MAFHTFLGKKRALDPGEKDRCLTKYPILLVHGTGFRDGNPVYNYWGRIPAALAARGARIYYGKQDAWGSVDGNAATVKRSIEEIRERDRVEKVNVIAHSKGGLEVRYMISRLGMADRVASLTTISTPHHGTKSIDIFYDAPVFLYKAVAFFVNFASRLQGDSSPDFYKASRQMSSRECAVFNADNRDAPGILYQSYAGKMKNPFSDLIYFFLHIFIKAIEGDSDGLVPVSSARWGEWKGLIESPNWRGVSHSDEVDAWRMDLLGFDVREVYVGIVEDLKARGF
jgi:triacylglycerol lipase